MAERQTTSWGQVAAGSNRHNKRGRSSQHGKEEMGRRGGSFRLNLPLPIPNWGQARGAVKPENTGQGRWALHHSALGKQL